MSRVWQPRFHILQDEPSNRAKRNLPDPTCSVRQICKCNPIILARFYFPFQFYIAFKLFYEPPLLSLNINGPMKLIHLDRPMWQISAHVHLYYPSMDRGPMCHPITFYKFQNHFISHDLLWEIILNIPRICEKARSLVVTRASVVLEVLSSTSHESEYSGI